MSHVEAQMPVQLRVNAPLLFLGVTEDEPDEDGYIYDLIPIGRPLEEAPEVPPGPDAKRCKICRKRKSQNAFSPGRSWCRACRNGILKVQRMLHPEPHWEATYRNRVTGYGFIPKVEPFTLEDLASTYGLRCFHCEEGSFDQLDHYPTPVCEGGAHSLANVRPSCQSCNSKGGSVARRRAQECRQEGGK